MIVGPRLGGPESDGTESFESFVRESAPRLLRLAHALTGERHDAEDLVQETLWKLGRAWSRHGSWESLHAYARRVLINQFLNDRRRRAVEARKLPALAGSSAPPDTPEPLPLAEAKRLLSALPPKQRAAVALRYLVDLDDEAIAGALGCSPSTVRSQIARALATLRRAEATRQGSTS